MTELMRKDIESFNNRIGKMNLQQLKDEFELTKSVIKTFMAFTTGNFRYINLKLTVYIRRVRFLDLLIKQVEQNKETEQTK